MTLWLLLAAVLAVPLHSADRRWASAPLPVLPLPATGLSGLPRLDASLPGAAPLQALARDGYALAPGAALLDSGTRRRLLAAADSRAGHWGWSQGHDSMPLQYHKTWNSDPGVGFMGAGGARPFVERLTRALRAALPGEDFVLDHVELRAGYRQAEGEVAAKAHVDGAYLTVTYPLRGPGTRLFPILPEGPRLLEPAPGQLAILSNVERAWLADALPIFHAEPEIVDPERVILVVRYSSGAALARRREAMIQAGKHVNDWSLAWSRHLNQEGPVADDASRLVK